MEYKFWEIDPNGRPTGDHKTFKTRKIFKAKYYILDMFPTPGAACCGHRRIPARIL